MSEISVEQPRDFKIVEVLLFYVKYATTLGETRVYILQSLRGEIMCEFHDRPIAGYLGKKKTYLKLRNVHYFPYMRKTVNQHVLTCHVCQTVNNKNALPAGRLIPIVTCYPNAIVTLDLLGPYPATRIKPNRYILVMTDHFSKWPEVIPLKKASAKIIADTLFESYISRYGNLQLTK
ncbi:retrovirus-related Pol polyprotein from transposon 297 [Trichonephila clavipes]|nr:retrovirus-related Pol polyprotein from transposon 297 [Trichonephila clavipes]